MFFSFLTILRELLPFLKEALLEGQSFGVWLKSNWLTFTCLMTTACLTLCVVFLAESLIMTRHRDHVSQTTIESLQVPLNNFVDHYKAKQLENSQLRQRVATLEITNSQQAAELEKYKLWMGDCGINLETGQCRVARQSVVRQSSRQKRRPKSSVETPPDLPEAKLPFLQRIRNMLKRDDKEKQTP